MTDTPQQPLEPRSVSTTATALAFGAAFGIVALLDAAGSAASMVEKGWPVLIAGSIASLFGALVGGVLGKFRSQLIKLSPFWTLGASLLFGSVLFVRLVEELSILNRWAGKTKADAKTALIASVCAGVLVFVSIAITQPRPEPKPLFVSLAWRNRFTRFFATALFTFGTGALIYVDRHAWPDSYPYAHNVLRFLAFAFAGLAADLAGIFTLHAMEKKHWVRVAPALLPAVAFMLAPLVPISTRTTHLLLSRPLSKYVVTFARLVTDVDRDGYSNFFAGGDCAPFDPSRHPMAHDTPGNGKQENCRSESIPPVPTPPVPAEATSPADASVVVITIDSLRPDHMSVYGYGNATTPQLDAWSKGALRFDRAYTAGGWTSLAIPAMLRGLYPRNMMWTHLDETSRMRLVRKGVPLEPKEWVKKTFALPLDDPHPTMQDLLHQRGLRTAAVVDDGYTGYFDKELGAFAGFDDYTKTDELPTEHQNDDGTANNAIAQLRKFDGGAQPFFLWVHFFGTHSPSTAHKGIARFGDGLQPNYDHEIAFMDQHVGRLLAVTDAMQTKRKMIVLVMADHGEEFGPQIRYHGLSAHEGAIRIPMFARGPSFEPGQTDRLTSIVDILPTVLEFTGAPLPSVLDGRSLATPRNRPFVFVDTWRFDGKGETILDLATAVDGSKKCTLNTIDLDRWCSDKRDREIFPAPAELDAALNRYLDQSGAITPHY